MKIHKSISNLSNEDLSEIISSLQNITWEEDALLRKLAMSVYEEDTVMHMLNLAVPLAMELNNRVTNKQI
jgi:hypothetical protein